MRSRPPQAISHNEFARMFKRCAPPRTGWSRKIGVANSGGPDSTCLLFLIHRHLSDETDISKPDFPRSVVSLTVDHDLQASSSAMAEHCAKVAQSMGTEHLTSKIPWSDAPYPPRPKHGQMFENIARSARYHSLFEAMTQADVGVIAFGHHSDDQVETSLMRLGRGTTELGAGGMRHCRRWGMGMGKDESFLGWAGYEGMKRWIVRPLLDVSKDRILATCEANNLEYITDKTNFQPHITLRNALRHRIQGNNPDGHSPAGELMPADIAEKLASIEKGVSSLKSVSMNLDSGAEQLRSAVSILTSNAEDIDNKVDSILKRSKLPSFPGTFLISSRRISDVRDDMLRKAMILRIMRYISFHPWGSIRADANRRSTSLNQVIQKIWDPNSFQARIFVAGGGVLWTPVAIRGNSIKTPDRIVATGVKLEEETFGWLASRQPPLSRQKLRERGISNSLEIEITNNLKEALKNRKHGGPCFVHILYDCRFLVHFNLEKMPEDLATQLLLPGTESAAKIMIYSRTRWYWPLVVREGPYGTSDVLHSKIDETPTKLLLEGEESDDSDYWRPHDKGVPSEWITIEWIRSLDAL